MAIDVFGKFDCLAGRACFIVWVGFFPGTLAAKVGFLSSGFFIIVFVLFLGGLEGAGCFIGTFLGKSLVTRLLIKVKQI